MGCARRGRLQLINPVVNRNLFARCSGLRAPGPVATVTLLNWFSRVGSSCKWLRAPGPVATEVLGRSAPKVSTRMFRAYRMGFVYHG